MKRSIVSMLVIGTFFLLCSSVLAYPLLQLDITNEGVSYDPSNETIVTADPTFQLVALLNTDSGQWMNKVSDTTTFYIVVSWNTATTGGFYDFDSTTYFLDDGGEPPSNPQLNHGELGTYGDVIPFTFTGNTTSAYNTQTDPGEFAGDVADGPFYYELFDVDVSGIGDFQPIHFDLFAYEDGSETKKVFAPFSHDASAVPEPATMILLGSGLLGLAGFRRKFRKG